MKIMANLIKMKQIQGLTALDTLVQSLNTTVTTEKTGLVDKVTAAEGAIAELKNLVGSGTEDEGTKSLATRLDELEVALGLVKDSENSDQTIKAVSEQIQDAINALKLADTYADKADTTKRLADLEKAVGTVEGEGDSLGDRVGALETTVGDATAGLVADVTTLKGTAEVEGSVKHTIATNVEALKGTADDTASDTTVYGAKAAAKAAQDDVDALEVVVGKPSVTTGDGEDAVTTPGTGLIKRVEDVEAEVKKTTTNVTDLVTEKIAAVVAGAPEDFDTLKEMSDWIAGHENDATAMNSAIKANTDAIGSASVAAGEDGTEAKAASGVYVPIEKNASEIAGVKAAVAALTDETVIVKPVTGVTEATTTVTMAEDGYTLVTGVKAKVVVNTAVYVVDAAETVNVGTDVLGFALEAGDDVYVEFRATKNASK